MADGIWPFVGVTFFQSLFFTQEFILNKILKKYDKLQLLRLEVKILRYKNR